MAIPEKRFQELVGRESFSDWLPYIAYEEGLYLLSDGNLGFIFEIAPLLEAGSDTHKILTGLYNSEFFPPGSTVQWHVFASERISPLLETWKNRRSEELRRFSEERVKLYTQEIKVLLEVPARDFKFLISVKVPGPKSLKSNLLHGEGMSSGTWEKYGEEVIKIKESVRGILESAFLLPRDFPP